MKRRTHRTCEIDDQEQSGNTIRVLYPMEAANTQRGRANGAPLGPILKRRQEGSQGSVELQSQRSTNYMQAILESKCKHVSNVYKATSRRKQYEAGGAGPLQKLSDYNRQAWLHRPVGYRNPRFTTIAHKEAKQHNNEAGGGAPLQKLSICTHRQEITTTSYGKNK